MNAEDRLEAIEKIQREIIELKESPLYEYRIKENHLPVIGEGNLFADIMFIGEAPGAKEAKTGRPFIGAAGKFLDVLLGGVGIKREDVYITSVVKDRPPENRDPTPAEIALYAPFLDRQIDIIQPKVIATLGRFSMNYVMDRLGLSLEIEPISKAHGKSYEAKTSYGTVKIIPLYHPAMALYKGSMRAVLQKDFEMMKQFTKK